MARPDHMFDVHRTDEHEVQSESEMHYVPPPRGKMKMGIKFLVSLFFLVLAVFVTFVYVKGVFPKVQANTWQSVFLTNGQAYFGHLKNVNRDYVALSNVFYLRTAQAPQPEGNPQPAFDLVKLGSELHGPQDNIYFPKSAIFFWEDMKDDSQVVKAIDNFLKDNQKK